MFLFSSSVLILEFFLGNLGLDLKVYTPIPQTRAVPCGSYSLQTVIEHLKCAPSAKSHWSLMT